MRACMFGACIIMATLAAAQDLPDPSLRSDEPIIGPAPVPVMEQMFWVQLKLDPAVEVEVTAPEGVTFLDRTKPGTRGLANAGYSRLYFRADRGIAAGEIVITPAGGAAVTVPLTVRTYREDIEEQIKVLANVDPSVRKAGRSYYTDGLLAIARENLEREPDLAKSYSGAGRYDSMTDEEIFAALPSWNVPRDCYSNFPCPICGEIIFKKSGFYPWSWSDAEPFKCKCPHCGGLFPTNDWLADDFTSGEYPDDGWGFDLADNGDRTDFAAWIAYWNHHALWQRVGGEMRRLSYRYLLEGDKDAAHRLGVLLARMAYVYPGMNMRWQQVDDGYIRRGRLLLDGNWERTQILVPACQAYDAIWDYLATDQALADFLHEKDPTINEPDDVRALIDTYLIQVFGWDWLRRELSGGNMGARETDLAYMAVCANMGPVSDRWIEELFTHAYSSGLNKGGFDDETLINTMTREGPVWIAALGYAYGYLDSKSNMAEILSRVESEKWGARCNLYDETLYPKWRAEFDTWQRMTVAGQFGPNYGDSGKPPGSRYDRGIVRHLRKEYARAWRHWPTDDIAQALYRAGKPKSELFEPYVWEEIAAQAEAAGPAPPLQSRVLDGLGFVFLESRADAEDINDRAGLALRYGYGHGHHHCDNLNIEMWAHGQDLAPELGYPCWAHPMGATDHTAHHCTGMIDYGRQYNGPISHGTLEMYAGAPEASFADVSAEPDGFPNRVYRRMVCLADGPEGNVYLLDIMRMAGGTTRTWCFHGPQQKAFETNLTFGPIEADPLPIASGRRLQPNIVNVQRASSDADIFADWSHRGADLHLRIDLLGETNRSYLTATYAKTDVPDIRFLFAEDEAYDGASEFVAVWQPYTDAPFIKRIERLPVEGYSGEGEFGPVAVRVTMTGGQVDTLICSPDPKAELTAGGITLRGSFGYWSTLDGAPRCAHLVGGTLLTDGDAELTLAEAATIATITDVDLTGNLITLDAQLPVGDALAGRMIFLTSQNGRHRTAYEIAGVLKPGNVVRLRHNSIIYRSKVDGFAEDGSHMTCELPLALEAGRGFKPGYYDGALVTG
ncbi:MAG: heparinase II/III family protein, partial [Armatimonadetes bacterium]|nr:heparinase II/III family protein [Armatimonadota bacterium]